MTAVNITEGSLKNEMKSIVHTVLNKVKKVEVNNVCLIRHREFHLDHHIEYKALKCTLFVCYLHIT